MSTSKALAKRPSPDDSALMPPPPPPKRIKRPPKVIPEDTYTSALSHIIARDFFPGLLETETQQDYLNALDANDPQWIEEAERRVRQVMTPGRQGGRRGVSMTPKVTLGDGNIPTKTPIGWKGSTPLQSASSTPARSHSGSDAASKEPEVDTTLSLSAFQAKYTSEDNESFNKVLDKQNATRRAKYPWLWHGNKLPTARQIAQAAQHQRLLKETGEHSNDRIAANSTALVPRPSADQDARPAAISSRPNYTNQGPRNTLMFTPDELPESLPTIAQTAQERSNAPPKAVNYGNTRLDTSTQSAETSNTTDTDTNPPSPTLSAIDAAIRGRPPPRRASTIASSSVAGSETPRVNGYAFVDEQPTPDEAAIYDHGAPAQSKDTNLLSELLQAHSGAEGGTAAGAPNPFHITEASSRESLHHRLVDKQAQAKRAPNDRLASLRSSGEGMLGKTPPPKFASSPRMLGKVGSATKAQGGLTPAARSLYERVGRERGKSGAGGAGIGGAAKDGGAFGASSEQSLSWERTPVRGRKTPAGS